MPQNSTNTYELTLKPGLELGNFTIRKVIGQGGFGITYLAYDRILQTEVVIKENMPTTFAGRSAESHRVVPLANATEDFEWATERFLQEARTMAKLKHRNIVSVTRVFKALGTAYYVMPYVGGSALDKVLEKEGPLPEERLRPLLYSLLDALQYLHGKELLHRDIKPANILLDEEGQPILIDFGAARQLSQHSQTVVESPGYTPFEQMQTHGEIGPWTDLYALGGTMYKLITGHPPMRSMDRVGKDTLAPLADRADLSKSYSRSFLKGIDKALSFNARKRWQTAEEWQQSLNAERKTSSSSRRPVPSELPAATDEQVPPPRKRTKRILLWSAAVTVLIGVVTLLCFRDDLLWVSCRNGNKTMASLMLTVGADIEAKNDDGWTPLIRAAEMGHKAAVRLLLDKGANINAKDKYGYTPLITAAHSGHEAVVRLLLERGADPEAKNNNQKTAWDSTEKEEIKKILKKAVARKRIKEGLDRHISKEQMLRRAAELGEVEVAEVLIDEWGANIEAVDENYKATPLLFAVLGGHENVVRLLLDRGAKVEVREEGRGRTPLHTAIAEGHTVLVALLLERGAKVNAQDKKGATPLLIAAASGHTDVARLLLEKSADVSISAEDGSTPLHEAAKRGHTEMVALLLERGAKVNAQDRKGATPLMLAAASGHTDAARLLLEKSADVSISAEDGSTPLHEAAKQGHTEMVELLLSKGADPTVKNKAGKTAWDLAEKEEIKKRLRKSMIRRKIEERLQSQTKENLLDSAITGDETDLVELLLNEYRVDLSTRDSNGWTPLYSAVVGNNTAIVKLLLEHGADTEAKDKNGRTPLYSAVVRNKAAIVKMLLEHDADTEAKNEHGWTPLHYAAWNDHESTVRLLLDKGANINATNKNGSTPLIVATQEGHEAVVRLLLEKDANIEAKEEDGSTPLIWAAYKGHEAIVRLLLEKGADPRAKDNNGRTAYDWASTDSIKRLIRSYQR